jgi:hypothetical protein
VITIQYEVQGRRGAIDVREKTFTTEATLVRWVDKNADRVRILRYER